MPQYRLAQKADHGLLNIASYGIEQCWAERSRRYDSKLKERFDERAEQPERYPLVEHIRKGYRRSVYGVPSIYYRIDGESVEIVRVSGRQDPTRRLERRPTMRKPVRWLWKNGLRAFMTHLKPRKDNVENYQESSAHKVALCDTFFAAWPCWV